MIELWLGLIVLTLIAMCFLFWPLFTKVTMAKDVDRKKENINIFQQRLTELQIEKNQGLLTDESLAELTLELEKNLLLDASDVNETQYLHEKVTKRQFVVMLLLCVMLIATSISFYIRYGSYDEVVWAANNTNPAPVNRTSQPTFEEAVALLESELAKNPENPEGWYILAGHYMRMGAFNKGASAFSKVIEYLPAESPQYASVIGQYAQALFFIENKVSNKVKEQINKALSIDRKEVISLGLLGIEAFEQEEYQKAINFWQESLVNAEPSAAQALRSGIENAKQELAKLSIDPLVEKTTDKNKLKIVVDVEISEEIKNSVDKNAVLFVFARPIDGRIPLAAMRLSVADLPRKVVLDDSLAMIPSAKISMQDKVEVSARISLSGQPQSQLGDYESDVLVLNVSTGNSSYKLLINKVVKE